METAYETRLTKALAELDGAKIKRSNATPPIFRLAQRMGLNPRPPHYMSFTRAVLLTGPAFGLGWGLIMWIVVWNAQGLPMIVALLASIMAGALFGLLMAAYYRWSAGEAGLSRWDEL